MLQSFIGYLKGIFTSKSPEEIYLEQAKSIEDLEYRLSNLGSLNKNLLLFCGRC